MCETVFVYRTDELIKVTEYVAKKAPNFVSRLFDIELNKLNKTYIAKKTSLYPSSKDNSMVNTHL